MNKHGSLHLVASAALATLFLAGCGNAEGPADEAEPGEAQQELRACSINYPCGGNETCVSGVCRRRCEFGSDDGGSLSCPVGQQCCPGVFHGGVSSASFCGTNCFAD